MASSPAPSRAPPFALDRLAAVVVPGYPWLSVVIIFGGKRQRGRLGKLIFSNAI